MPAANVLRDCAVPTIFNTVQNFCAKTVTMCWAIQRDDGSKIILGLGLRNWHRLGRIQAMVNGFLGEVARHQNAARIPNSLAALIL